MNAGIAVAMKPEENLEDEATSPKSRQAQKASEDPNSAAAKAYSQPASSLAIASCETGQCDPAAGSNTPHTSSKSAVASHSSSTGLVEDPMRPETFLLPIDAVAGKGLPQPTVVIEYCDRCRWQHRATWIQTELFLTFPTQHDSTTGPTKASGGASLQSIMLIPRTAPETGGRFRLWLYHNRTAGPNLIWDRKVQGGFPELKGLKQVIRDLIAPGHGLGHSDKKS